MHLRYSASPRSARLRWAVGVGLLSARSDRYRLPAPGRAAVRLPANGPARGPAALQLPAAPAPWLGSGDGGAARDGVRGRVAEIARPAELRSPSPWLSLARAYAAPQRPWDPGSSECPLRPRSRGRGKREGSGVRRGLPRPPPSSVWRPRGRDPGPGLRPRAWGEEDDGAAAGTATGPRREGSDGAGGAERPWRERCRFLPAASRPRPSGRQRAGPGAEAVGLCFSQCRPLGGVGLLERERVNCQHWWHLFWGCSRVESDQSLIAGVSALKERGSLAVASLSCAAKGVWGQKLRSAGAGWCVGPAGLCPQYFFHFHKPGLWHIGKHYWSQFIHGAVPDEFCSPETVGHVITLLPSSVLMAVCWRRGIQAAWTLPSSVDGCCWAIALWHLTPCSSG